MGADGRLIHQQRFLSRADALGFRNGDEYPQQSQINIAQIGEHSLLHGNR
jgi:hypothetical protein